MQYLFSTLSKIVNQFIYEGGKATRPPSWHDELVAEKQNLSSELKKIKDLPHDRKELALYIKKHYTILLKFIDDLIVCADPDKLLCLSELEEVKFLMEFHFCEYGLLGNRDVLHLRCTIEELALLSRILIETGLIVIKSKREFSQFMNKHITLIGSEDQHFSEDHFYNSMFSHKMHSIRSVESILVKQKEALGEIKIKQH